MVERREHLCFALESRQPIRVGRKDVGKELDGNVAIELDVARAVDLAHAACAQRRQDFVRSEARASGLRHESRLILATERLTSKEKPVIRSGAATSSSMPLDAEKRRR